MYEVGVIEGRDLRHEPRRVRFGALRDRLEDVLWPNFTAPQKHLAVDVTVASARTSSIAPAVGTPLPLPGRQAVEAPLVKRDIDLRIGYIFATPSAQTIHYYYPFALGGGGAVGSNECGTNFSLGYLGGCSPAPRYGCCAVPCITFLHACAHDGVCPPLSVCCFPSIPQAPLSVHISPNNTNNLSHSSEPQPYTPPTYIRLDMPTTSLRFHSPPHPRVPSIRSHQARAGGAVAAAPERVRSQARRHLPLPPRGGRW
jgi:hypothetical protein